MKDLPIDSEYLRRLLLELLAIPSPSGYTDGVVHFVGEELERIGIGFDLTRRGAIRANLYGRVNQPDRALVAHLDTLGAIVTELKKNGRVAVLPIGNWSSRFAEGARATIMTEKFCPRGTILPLKASGHTYAEGIDKQPVSWENVEIRVDERVSSHEDLEALGIGVGDFVAIDPQPEATESGFIVSRHLDDKAGVACMLAAARAVIQSGAELPIDCHLLFTIFEEVGSGASAVLHQDVAEMVSIDNSTLAPGQNSSEYEVTIAMMDSSGPFDWHLSHRLIDLARRFEIPIRRDVFKNYRTDAASAVEAGNDIRTALLCFGVDGSHGYERTHIDCLANVSRLIAIYMQSPATIERDEMGLGPIEGFPEQPLESTLDADENPLQPSGDTEAGDGDDRTSS
jgi:peptidase M42 family hydrolase